METVTNKKGWATVNPVTATLLFIAFGLSYYGYLYYFAFNEGVSAAPDALKAVKDAAYATFLLAMLVAVPWTTASWREWIFAPFAGMLVMLSLIHAQHTGAEPQLIENIKNLAVYLPVFWLMFRFTPEQSAALSAAMQRLFVAMALIQVAFSYAFEESDGLLWRGHVYAGWIGNPNSFALFLNLATVALLALIVYESRRRRVYISAILIGVLTHGVLHSTSATQVLVHYLLICYCAVIAAIRQQRHALVSLTLVAAVMAAVSLHMHDRLQGSWQPVPDALDILTRPDSTTERSFSASRRLEMVFTALGVPGKGFMQALIGDLDNAEYHRLDGQFWTLLANGGFLTMLAFAVPALYVYLVSLRYALRGGQALLALHLMIVAFGVTLLASRVLQYFPFNFLFFAIAGLAVRPAVVRSLRAEGEVGR